MNIDDLTLRDIKELRSLFSGAAPAEPPKPLKPLIGKFVIVRCRDAGVHAGVLTDYDGREADLTESRRLWYWKPANNASNLSGVATEGLHANSKVGAPVTIHLTETCEIIVCSTVAEKSIREAKSHVQ